MSLELCLPTFYIGSGHGVMLQGHLWRRRRPPARREPPSSTPPRGHHFFTGRGVADPRLSCVRQVIRPTFGEADMESRRWLVEKFEEAGVLSAACARIVLEIQFFARIARPDLLASVNTVAREVTRWTAA